MTLEEIQKAYDEQLPVVVHAPYNPDKFCRKWVGWIDRIVPESRNPESRERQTHKEPCVWVTFPNQDRVFLWANEIRIARLRNPIVIKREFIHTSSNRYCTNDTSHKLSSPRNTKNNRKK